MADWFVSQCDIFANELDPDALGVMLIPVYDVNRNIVYRETENFTHNGIRRVQSKWGVDPDIKQYDFVIQTPVHSSRKGLPPLHTSTSMTTQTYKWFPTHHQLNFTNNVDGFSVENSNTKQCLDVIRDASSLKNQVKFMHQDIYGKYTICVGQVVGVRIHKLVLFNPMTLKSWFSKFVTAHTSSSVNSLSNDTFTFNPEQT